MKKWYKKAALAIIAAASTNQILAQSYGVGAGTQGSYHAFFGDDAGKKNSGVGHFNTFIGGSAGKSNTNGTSNTFTGHLSGGLNVSGKENTYTGYYAGLENLGSYNVMLGSEAGAKSSGDYNILIGKRAGWDLTGTNNVLIGFKTGNWVTGSGRSVVIGDEAASYQGATLWDNTFVGYRTGYKSKTGARNSFLGAESGYANEGGTNNSFFGYFTGHTNSGGNFNAFFGSHSGYSNTIGANNVFMGNESGYYNQSGNGNSFVGVRAGYENTVGEYNAFLGTESGFKNTFGKNNTALGYRAGYSNTTGSQNVYIGNSAGYSNLSGENNTYIGSGSGSNVSLFNTTTIGAQAKVTKNNSVVIGNNANVGIGISAPDYLLHLGASSAAKAGSSTWTIASDERLKKDVSEYREGLDLLKQVKPVWFSYNGKADMPTDKKFVGIIAQDMQKIASHMVGTFTYQDSLGNKTEYLDYDANALTYMLVNAVKEQQQVIEDNEGKMQEMSTQLTELTNRLAQLEKIVAASTIKPLTGIPSARQLGEPNANGVILEQNFPNGFSGKTSIIYFIPQSVKDAVIHIYSIDGKKISTHTVNQRGQGELQLSADQLSDGVFVYDLVTDGKSNGAKKMMVNK
ncbi:tail fiber domain-containing protein [Dyadobacter aurulentus]|uniref:tail fiber domain-containing protein n=1 Tax=Dyadobacter sp. UC 10 TaxID=2605428 RepID=UPI0011F0AF83|nr:tail fiber domain-containing protein [Dyadobacter sp. UC 10]KAA0989403.1 tail fiber domain-containing protein [Dyadobacter sp. UC 10]